ncbi:MAG: hypothetical protein MUF84_13525, partial [Anaerolineae bacterium]|nr:hypothetical protein [Anaerolineae bacterium]
MEHKIGRESHVTVTECDGTLDVRAAIPLVQTTYQDPVGVAGHRSGPMVAVRRARLTLYDIGLIGGDAEAI